MLNLVAQADRLFFETAPSKIQMALLLLLPIALGFGVYLYFERREPSDPLYKARWAGFVPFGVGAIIGFLNVRNVNDYIYQQSNLVGQNMKMIHYASLVIPILGAAALFVLARMRQRAPKYDF